MIDDDVRRWYPFAMTIVNQRFNPALKVYGVFIEDLESAALEGLWRGLETCPAPPGSDWERRYLATFIHRRVVDLIRLHRGRTTANQRKRHVVGKQRVWNPLTDERPVDGRTDRGLVEIEDQLAAACRTERQRRVVDLLHAGMTRTEVAEHLGVTPGAVTHLLDRVRDRIVDVEV